MKHTVFGILSVLVLSSAALASESRTLFCWTAQDRAPSIKIGLVGTCEEGKGRAVGLEWCQWQATVNHGSAFEADSQAGFGGELHYWSKEPGKLALESFFEPNTDEYSKYLRGKLGSTEVTCSPSRTSVRK